MKLSILTPDKKLIQDVETNDVFLPGAAGIMEILEGHADMIAQLETGIVKWKEDGKWHAGALSRGFVEIENQNVNVLAEVAELSDGIDVERAKAALDKAKQKLESAGLGDDEFQKYELKLKRAMNRISASEIAL